MIPPVPVHCFSITSIISIYDFPTLYTTLPHDLIKTQLVDLIENKLRREEDFCLACNEERAFFASEEHNKIYLMDLSKSNRSACLSFGQYLY